MITKIAIAGWPKSNKTLLALALSNMTGIPFIQNRTMYEWRKIHDLTDSPNTEWKDMYLIASSSFFERAVMESYYEQFISDGASFSEIMWMKICWEKQCPEKMQFGRDKTTGSLEQVCALYAEQQYDFIIHAGTGNADCPNDLYEQLYAKYHLPYRMYSTENMEETVNEIKKDLHLPVKHSVESAIYQAKVNLFLKP